MASIISHRDTDTSQRGVKEEVFEQSEINYGEAKLIEMLNTVRVHTFLRVGLPFRILWLAVCIVCAFISVSMMMVIYNRYQITPTVTIVETTNYPIWNLPFPAVTVCNNNHVNLKSALRLASELSTKYEIKNETILEYLKLLSNLVYPRNLTVHEMDNVRHVENILDKEGLNMTDIMVQLAHPCESMLNTCYWLSKKRDCLELFNVSRTSRGICCSFNYRGVKPELTFSPNAPDVLQYVSGAGRGAGLKVYVDMDEDNYFSPMPPTYGIGIDKSRLVGISMYSELFSFCHTILQENFTLTFMVLIHDPMSYPENSVRFFQLEPSELLVVILHAEAVESSSDVRMISISQRQCWFEEEAIAVESDVQYSFRNCITECRMKVIREECDCTPFYYPPFNKSSRECRISDSNCLVSISGMIAGVNPGNGVPAFSSHSEEFLEKIGMNCSCLPSCTDKRYYVETHTSKVNDELTILQSPLSKDSNLSYMAVYFDEFTCIKYKRDVYMTRDSMFATLGGVFGLFMGGSVISLFELVYRLLRLACATFRTMKCKSLPQRNKSKVVRPWDTMQRDSRLHLSAGTLTSRFSWYNNIMY